MKTLLRIDSSARKQGSHSRALADYFQTLWLQANPGGQIVSRDLAETPVQHLSNSTIAAFTGVKDADGSPAPDAVTLSDALIAEVQAADQVILSSPLYNFNVPSTLKAWIDHVVRFGRTFAMSLAIESGRIHRIYALRNPDKLAVFDRRRAQTR